MQDLLPLYTSAHGSVSRRDFWIAAAVLLAAGIVLGFIPIIGSIASILLLYPWTCLAMRRLRDMGRAPAIALLPIGLCTVSALLAIVTAASIANPVLLGTAMVIGGIAVLVGTLSMILALLFLIWIGLAPGQHENAVSAPLHTRR